MSDLYPRPSRDAIAARVTGQLPGGEPPAPPQEPEPRGFSCLECGTEGERR